MYRTALRSASRPVVSAARSAGVRAAPRRFASTASPADKPRTWKSSALRWGLAVGAVYYYNASPIFADEAMPKTVPPPASFADSDLPTVDSVIEEKRKEINARLENPREKQQKLESKTEEPSGSQAQTTAVAEGLGEVEEEAGQQAAFNPETGEINWDCPCLGGMADGPCGEQFKTAFSCFVYSDQEPKGMECIDKFQGMQECFREYPEIYGAELADEADADAALEDAGEPQVQYEKGEPVEGEEPIKAAESKTVAHDVAEVKSDAIPTHVHDATAANKETASKE